MAGAIPRLVVFLGAQAGITYKSAKKQRYVYFEGRKLKKEYRMDQNKLYFDGSQCKASYDGENTC